MQPKPRLHSDTLSQNSKQTNNKKHTLVPELGAGKGFPGMASIPSTAEKEGKYMNYVENDKKLSPWPFTQSEKTSILLWTLGKGSWCTFLRITFVQRTVDTRGESSLES